MAAFTGVAAVALVIMMGFLFATYKAVATMRDRSSEFMDRWEPLADTAQKAIEELSTESKDLLVKVQELTETTQRQVAQVESVVRNVSETTQVQLDRVDNAVQDAVHRVQETTAALQDTILLPVRQIRAVTAAVGAVMDHLFGKQRPTVDQATLDEEMFI